MNIEYNMSSFKGANIQNSQIGSNLAYNGQIMEKDKEEVCFQRCNISSFNFKGANIQNSQIGSNLTYNGQIIEKDKEEVCFQIQN